MFKGLLLKQDCCKAPVDVNNMPLLYTERQEKLITSSEWHSLKSKASTWIIFGHKLGKFVLNKHMLKNKSLLQSKRR